MNSGGRQGSARRGVVFALVLGCALVLLALLVMPARRQNPLVSRFQRLAAEIYDTASWAGRVPYELGVPLIARARLRAYVDDLPLPDEVRTRVLARIGSPGFVDEIVPFLLFVQGLYAVEEEDAARSFDAHLRATYQPTEPIPGMEHSMFAWQQEDVEGSGGLELDERIVVQLVSLYDGLYLRESDPAAALSTQLSCATRVSAESRRGALPRVRANVRGLLEQARPQIDVDSEIGHAITGILDDPARLDTVTLSLIQFIDQLVCKHYRIFATRVFREQQLRNWMLGELHERGEGQLWDFLEAADTSRRYAVLIVVDGLQGRLLEALASGAADDPFIARVRDEHRNTANLAPATQKSVPAPAQQLHFLTRLAERGYHDFRYLPFFRDLFTRPYGIAQVGVATTPTISVRNLPIAWTGAPVGGPGGSGIPNFHFVDRSFSRNGEQRGRPYYFYGNDALHLAQLTRDAGMRSLFDRLPELNSFSCGAQYDDAAHFSLDAFLNLAFGEKLRDFGEVRCLPELERRAGHARELAELRKELLGKRAVLSESLSWYQFYLGLGRRDELVLAERLIAQIAELETQTVPELLVYYNPWPDHFAHFTGPFADEVIAPSGELARLDYWLGRVAEVYRSAGVEERTLFGMAGDHGLSPVFHLLNPEVEVFDRLREEGTDLAVVKISSDEGEGPKLNHPLDPPSMKGIDAVVASTAGGNYMIDLFKDQAAGFVEQPLFADLGTMKPLANRDRDDAPGLALIDEIYARLSESLDYLVVRETVCDPSGGEVRVIGGRDGARAEARIVRRGDRVRYVYEGADLLDTDRLSPYESHDEDQAAEHATLRARCVDAAGEAPASWCTESQWQRLTSFTPRPGSVVQLSHLYDVDRSGTINLFPKAGIGYNTRVPGRHAGESFHEKNAFVGLWGRPVRRYAETDRLRTAVNGSVPVTLHEYLSGTRVTPGLDGFGFPSLGAELLEDHSRLNPCTTLR